MEGESVCVDSFVRGDEERVIELWKKRFGAPDSHISEWVEAVYSSSQTTGFVVRIDECVMGFIIVTVSTEEWVNYEYIGKKSLFVDAWENTGIVHMICVDEDVEGEGLGSLLMHRGIEWFESMNIDGVVAVAWVRDEHYGSVPLFEKFGLEIVAFDADFYAGLDESVYCSVCDYGCECGSAVLQAEW